MRRSLIVAAMAALLLVVGLAPAGAAPPADVEIEADSLLAGTGTFTASGAAVDDGVVCATGNTLDLSVASSGSGPWGHNIRVIKEFTCDDGSGSFLVKLQVRKLLVGPLFTTFHWVVQGGDGYAGLHGSGSGVGLPPNSGFDVFDVYTGFMLISG